MIAREIAYVTFQNEGLRKCHGLVLLTSETDLFVFLFSFKSSLHTVDISSLLDMCFANFSSKFMAYVLILMTVSFTEQKF